MNALPTRPSDAPPIVEYHVAITKQDLESIGVTGHEGINLPFYGRPQPTDQAIKQGAGAKVLSILQQSAATGSAATAVGLCGQAVYSAFAAGGPLMQNLGTLDVTNPLFTGAAVALGATTAYYGAKVALGAVKTTRELAGQALLFESKGNPELPALRSNAVLFSGFATQLLTTGATLATSAAYFLSQPAGYIAAGVAAAGAAIAGIATWITGSNWAGMQRTAELNHEARKAITAFEGEVAEQLQAQHQGQQPQPTSAS